MKRCANILFAVFFAAFLFGVPVLTVLGPHSGSSFYENRTLAPVPELTLDGLMDGQYFDDVETALSDHIALRDRLLKLNTLVDITLGRPVVNDIVVSSDVLLDFHGYLSWDTSYLKDVAAEIGEDFKALNDKIKAYGGYFCYLGVPLQSTYFASRYPGYMDSRLWHMDANRLALSDSLSENNVPFIDMRETYASMGFPAEYYSKADHHFTYRGAFAAYTALMERINSGTGLNLSVLTEDDLDFETLPNPCLGSSNRKIYGLWRDEDRLETAVLKSPIAFTRTDNGVPVGSGLYYLPSNEEETVSYSLYMGGDIAETVIETNRPGLPNMLVFGDSFTNPLETLIWTGFNETRYLDLRYYTGMSIGEYIDLYKPDVVVCVRDESVFLLTTGNGDIS